MMKIATLGTGAMTGALVPHWVKAGHDVVLGGRDEHRAGVLAADLGARGSGLATAADGADVVVLAVRWEGVHWTLEQAGAQDRRLVGKVLVDCTNPVEVEHFTLTTDCRESLAERVARQTGARVVKAFNLCHAAVWRDMPHLDGRPLVVPMATDDRDAADVVGELVRLVGGEPLDAGPLQQARHLEAMAAIVIRLLFGGATPKTVFNLIRGDAEPTT
jgi:predicted dinucleotide-binding enzyme